MKILEVLLVSFLAFGGGFIGSVMSGGSLITLFILSFLGVPTKVAIGTLKLVIAGLTLVSTITYFKRGIVDAKLALSLTISSLFGAFLGSLFFLSIPENLANIIVASLLLVGMYFMIKQRPSQKEPKLESRVWQVIIGFLIGVYISILGIASTLIIISTLLLFFKLDILRANGTAKMIIFFNNLVATINYALAGNVNYSVGILILIPVLFGSWLGARTALEIGKEKLKAIFIFMTILTIMKLVWDALL
ncbi:sulfite exporter TauE/SafE family protein [Thermococcus sp. M39]|uniref:sulfite exporter TauE/SafE family protein n=1 Tax=unclassified Thermococcus TaxID=2627626 RepID=UPI00143BEC4A|nr:MULTISPECIES: sulfite exporter TauE/SafE family protein [unclassified Thermococcus]NJE07491.1 sulfite exporter TauE/SafE family protein [Thermococcus sp. M39]NJE13815.1 sulfite exporter TauE/SafE family protein [Thermococcus sp. LS2]